jgi:hypothetical protein
MHRGRGQAETMPFGRYEGQPVSELPDGYVRWLWSLTNLRDPLRTTVEREYRRRFDAPAPRLLPSPAARDAACALVAAGYRTLVKKTHPDVGGDHAAMVALTAARDFLRAVLGETA